MPNTDHIILISVDKVHGFSRAALPHVCKPYNSKSESFKNVKYQIQIALRDNLAIHDKKYVLCFRDSVNIYANGKSVFIDINKKYVEERQVLANMGISIALSYIFCEESIYLMHSASIVRNNAGYIFPGQSGSGKTTISKLSQKENLVLCDELSALTLNSKHLGDLSESMYGLLAGPRWAEFTFNPIYYHGSVWGDDPFSVYPLKAIIFPSRDKIRDQTWIEKVDSIDATVLLLGLFTDTAFVKALPSKTYEKAFHFFSDLAKRTPCFRIHANINTNIWDTIDNEMETADIC